MRNYLLLTPGPLSTSATVRESMLQDWCTWDKDYNEGIVTPIRQGLLDLASVKPDKYTTVLLQGSGTYCVEATIGTVVKPTDQLLVIANGAYGERIGEIARYYGINCHLISLKETEQITPEIVRNALEQQPQTTHFAMVHSETTTGILNPLEDIAKVVREFPVTFIVDAMSSFGGVEIKVDKWDIDFLVSSANKCIQGVPGFGFVIAKKEILSQCKGIARSLSLDLYAQWETMETGNGKWRFTSPTHTVRAFWQAMQELREEGGVRIRAQRYLENNKVLIEGMEKLGFKSLLSPEIQGPIISSFLYPTEDFSFVNFYEKLKSKGFVIYPGKISEAKTFRIGNIGDVYPRDIRNLLYAIEEII